MDQFITEVESYCAALGIRPQQLLRNVLNAKWSQWDAWVARSATPTMASVDRLRAHMAAHPAPAPAAQSQEDAA